MKDLLRKTFSTMGGDGKTPQLSDELKQRILNPELYDPLSLAAGEAMSVTAEAKGQDLVAYLPDSSFGPLTQSLASPTMSAFKSSWASAGLIAKEENGWLLVEPRNPASSRDRRANRSALGAALKLMNTKGYLGLDDWAGFARKQAKAPRYGEFDETFFRLINTPAADAGLGQFTFGGGWQTLQFYASLTTAQKQAMNQSGRVPLNNLSGYQLGLLTEQVFNSFEGPTVANRQDPTGRPAGFIMGMASVQNERTLLMPNGIPRNGFLRITYRTNEIIQANSTANGGARFFSAEDLAFERVRAEQPELASFGGGASFDKFRMASQRTVGFMFQLTPDISLSRQLEDNMPGSQAFGSYDSLPADFRKKVDQAAEALSRGWGSGGGPGRVPPPSL